MPAISPGDGPVAVTGVTGFTGGHMVRELVSHGYRVHACLRDATSWRGQDGVAYLKTLPNVDIFEGCDLFKAGSFDEAFAGCTAVFAVAAVLGNSSTEQPAGSGDAAKDVYDGAMFGMRNIVDSVNKNISVKRLIYTSSVAAVRSASRTVLGHEWTEADWASDGTDSKVWNHPRNAYNRSKVDAEHLINQAAAESGGRWDVVSVNPAMICGPLLFKAQNGQWIESLGRLAGGVDLNMSARTTSSPGSDIPWDMYWSIIDVRDVATAERLAAEAPVDHKASSGGARYLLHGCGGRDALKVSTGIQPIIAKHFPNFQQGKPATLMRKGQPVEFPDDGTICASNKAKKVLGMTFRCVEDTIRDTVQSAVLLGLVQPKLVSKL